MSTSAVEEILGQLPLPQLAAQLGVDPQTAAQAAAAVIPSLIGGLQHNADQGQEQAIAGALAQHSSSNLFDSGSVDLNSVDTADGAKIVQHIFGDQSTQLAHAIGQKTGASGSLVNQLLPILAPIVLAYLAKKLTGSQQAGGGGMLGSILGGILSGGARPRGQTRLTSRQAEPRVVADRRHPDRRRDRDPGRRPAAAERWQHRRRDPRRPVRQALSGCAWSSPRHHRPVSTR